MELNLPCPEEGCDGELDHGRAGRRRAIICTKCDLQVFGNVDKETGCPKCDVDWTLVLNRTKKRPRKRLCPKSTCDYDVEEIEPDEQEAEDAATAEAAKAEATTAETEAT